MSLILQCDTDMRNGALKTVCVKIILPIVIGLMLLLLYPAVRILYFSSDAAPGKADAAIVLGAASFGEAPSPVFRERINYAVRLYRRGMVKKIIFTGARDSADEPAASAVASRYAAHCGVPRQDILTEDSSATTEENLSFARDLAAARGLKTFYIVSDPLHMMRAMAMAEDLSMIARPAPTPTTRYRSLGRRARFLAREVYYYDAYMLRTLPARIKGLLGSCSD